MDGGSEGGKRRVVLMAVKTASYSCIVMQVGLSCLFASYYRFNGLSF